MDFFGKEFLGKYFGWKDCMICWCFFLLFVCVFFSYGCDSISKIPWDSSPCLFHHFYLGLDIFGSFSIRILGKSKVRFLRHGWTRWIDFSDRKEETKKRKFGRVHQITNDQIKYDCSKKLFEKKESHILE